jgi:hypothetical protein
MTVLVQAEPAILAALHPADTHRVAILHIITKDIRHPDRGALVDTSTDIEGQMADLAYA